MVTWGEGVSVLAFFCRHCFWMAHYSKMGLHAQMFLLMLLNVHSNSTTWIQCMIIRIWLQMEDSLSFNKHVIGGVRIEHKVVVRTAMEIRKKCDSNFVVTLAIAKVRYGDITMAKIFVKNLFLVVYQWCNDAL